MIAVVLAMWLIGTWVTKYSLEQMAVFAPVAVVVVGATIGLVLLWVKIVRESIRGRRTDSRASRNPLARIPAAQIPEERPLRGRAAL